MLRYKNGDNVSDSVELLISMLVKYPEIGTINFDPENNNIKITFIMLKLIGEQVLEKFRGTLLSCLKTFYYLEGKQPDSLEVNYSFCEDITLLEYIRDVSTLTSEEISLTIEAVKEGFAEYLLSDSGDDNNREVEDELLEDDELIGKLLDNVRYAAADKKLIAFREEGRVMIFNK